VHVVADNSVIEVEAQADVADPLRRERELALGERFGEATRTAAPSGDAIR
jgi:hypothetical protein